MKKLGAGRREQGARGELAAAGERLPREHAAFTLIELMVVVAIIAVLAGLTLGTLGYVNRKGAESRARSEVAALAAAIDNYKLEFGSFPSTNATALFKELTGQGTVNKARVFIEPTPGLVTNATNGPFIDPWGLPYRYDTNPKAIQNVGFFDLWSTAGGASDQSQWIRN
jgi:type II secretion system protein G